VLGDFGACIGGFGIVVGCCGDSLLVVVFGWVS
jgi:hypothetical protein